MFHSIHELRQVRSTRSSLASHDVSATSSIASKNWKMRGVIAEAELSGCMGSRLAAVSVNYDPDDPMGRQMQIESI